MATKLFSFSLQRKYRNKRVEKLKSQVRLCNQNVATKLVNPLAYWLNKEGRNQPHEANKFFKFNLIIYRKFVLLSKQDYFPWIHYLP